MNNVGSKAEEKHIHGEDEEPGKVGDLVDGTAPEEAKKKKKKKKKKKAGKGDKGIIISAIRIAWLVKTMYVLLFSCFFVFPSVILCWFLYLDIT